MKNLEKVLARLAKVPVVIQDAAGSQLATEVNGLVDAQRRAAPIDETSKNPGEFRDSIHAYPNPDRPLSFRIIADARDADGKFIGGNIEHGHRAADGTHVAARPSFFPVYRARKKGMRNRLLGATRKRIKLLYPKE